MENFYKQKKTAYFICLIFCVFAMIAIWSVENPLGKEGKYLSIFVLSGSTIIAFVSLMFGLKLFKLWVILSGIVLGLVIGGLLGWLIALTSHNNGGASIILMALLLATIGGIVAWPLQKAIVFIMGGSWGVFFICIIMVLVKIREPGAYILLGLISFFAVGALTLYIYEYFIIALFALSAVNTFFFNTFIPSTNWERKLRWRTLENSYDDLLSHFALYLISATLLIAFSIYYQKFLRIEKGDNDAEAHQKKWHIEVCNGMAFISFCGYLYYLSTGHLTISSFGLLLFPIAVWIVIFMIDSLKKIILKNNYSAIITAYLTAVVLTIPCVILAKENGTGFYISLGFGFLVYPIFFITWIYEAISPVGMPAQESSKGEVTKTESFVNFIQSPLPEEQVPVAPDSLAEQNQVLLPHLAEIITLSEKNGRKENDKFSKPTHKNKNKVPVGTSIKNAVGSFAQILFHPLKVFILWVGSLSKKTLLITSGMLVCLLSLLAWVLVVKNRLEKNQQIFQTFSTEMLPQYEQVTKSEVRYENLMSYIKLYEKSKPLLTKVSGFCKGGVWFPSARETLFIEVESFSDKNNKLVQDAKIATGKIKSNHQELIGIFLKSKKERKKAQDLMIASTDNTEFQQQIISVNKSIADINSQKNKTSHQINMKKLDGNPEIIRQALLRFDISFLESEKDSLLNRKDALQAGDKLLIRHKQITSQLLLAKSKVIPFVNSIASNLAPATRAIRQKIRYLDNAVAALDRPVVSVGFFKSGSVLDALNSLFPQASNTVSLVMDLSKGIAQVDDEMNNIVRASSPFIVAETTYQHSQSRRNLTELIRNVKEVSIYYASKKPLFDPITDKLDAASEGLNSITRSVPGSEPFLSVAREIIRAAYSPFNAWNNTIDETTSVLNHIVQNEQQYIASLEELREYSTVGNDIISKLHIVITTGFGEGSPISSSNRIEELSIKNPDEILRNLGSSFIQVSGGSFLMGCLNNNSDCFPEEIPSHSVSISSFFISKYEVTQAEYTAVTGLNPSQHRNCMTCPIENVSWYDAKRFVELLNKSTGNSFRLPTEAEWEFAAYAQEWNYPFAGHENGGRVGWIRENSQGQSHAVGTKPKNRLGIYDITGNVWEWCEDWYDENYYNYSPSQDPTGPTSGVEKILRGGSWKHSERYCRNSNRGWDAPETRKPIYGFRLASSDKPR